MAAREQPRAHYCYANPLPQVTRPHFRRATAARLIHRTAGYGPVCPVVWEGRSREAPPYPDCRTWTSISVGSRQRASSWMGCWAETGVGGNYTEAAVPVGEVDGNIAGIAL